MRQWIQVGNFHAGQKWFHDLRSSLQIVQMFIDFAGSITNGRAEAVNDKTDI